MSSTIARPLGQRRPTSLSGSHLMPRGRAILLCGLLILMNLGGGYLLSQSGHWQPGGLWFAALLAAFTTVMVATPLIAFLSVGWFTRYNEFQNSLKDQALAAYLRRFWSQSLIHALQDAKCLPGPEAMQANGNPWWEVANQQPKVCDRLFSRIYHEQYGLTPFVPPFLILIAVAYAAAALLIAGCSVGTIADGATVCMVGLSRQLLVASTAGAFMFVVSDSVLNIRRKSLNTSDVYWYSLRLFLAIPIAIAISGTPGADGFHAAVAFALGTFPVDAFIKVIRRFGFPQVNADEQQSETPDKLLALEGVTLPIVATLAAEGIDSVEQIATADPVLLSIRTGFPFRYTLRLGSQAIVRRHFGANASALIPIGLADVVPIFLLANALDGKPWPNSPVIESPELVLQGAADRLFPSAAQQSAVLVKMKFRQIAAEEYTLMLAKLTPLDPSL
ncbi:MAG: hypothetical protein ACRYG5_07540 [Janthinobacterium lividum]